MYPLSSLGKSITISSLKLPELEQPIESKKEVKRGFRSFSSPMVCGVSFERLPAWIWVLRRVEWSDIIITEPDERRLRQAHPVVHERYQDCWRTTSTRVRDHPMAQEAVVWWVSGTLEFVKTLMLPTGVPQVSWIMGSQRRIPDRETIGHQWLSIAHAKVGGCTTARGVFRLTGVDHVVIPGDLTRNLSHIVKFSVRSKPCPPQLDVLHYKLSSKLSVQRLDLPIVVPSDFSATGWGQRQLEDGELAGAYELPDFSRGTLSFRSTWYRCNCYES